MAFFVGFVNVRRFLMPIVEIVPDSRGNVNAQYVAFLEAYASRAAQYYSSFWVKAVFSFSRARFSMRLT